MTMMATTMTAINYDGQRHNLVKSVQPCREYGDFKKVFNVFIDVDVMVHLVAIVVCGCNGVSPSCYRPPAENLQTYSDTVEDNSHQPKL